MIMGVISIFGVCTFSCGNSSQLLGDSSPINYDGSLKAAPINFSNLRIFATTVTGNYERGSLVDSIIKIENQGSSTINDSFYISAYLNSDSSISSKWLKSWKVNELNAKSFLQLSTQVTIPSNTKLGQATIEFWVDKSNKILEFNEADNQVTPFNINIVTRSQSPDLYASVNNFNESLRSLDLKIHNVGTGVINSEVFLYKVYLSLNDTVLDATDILLYSGDNYSNGSYISLGQNVYFQEEVSLFSFTMTAPGDYHLIIVTDSSDHIIEDNESNNQTVFFIKTVP